MKGARSFHKMSQSASSGKDIDLQALRDQIALLSLPPHSRPSSHRSNYISSRKPLISEIHEKVVVDRDTTDHAVLDVDTEQLSPIRVETTKIDAAEENPNHNQTTMGM